MAGSGAPPPLSLAAAGARVAAIDRDERGLEATDAKLLERGDGHVVARCDTSSSDSVTAVSETIEKSLGRAAFWSTPRRRLRPGGLETCRLPNGMRLLARQPDRLLRVRAGFRLDRCERAGAAVWCTWRRSPAAMRRAHSGAYSVSKAGVIMLSRQLGSEWGPQGIRSNVVSPGMVITPMSQSFYDTPGCHRAPAAVVPMRRIGMPQDMADAILFLASDRASYVNGEEIVGRRRLRAVC